MTVDDLIDYEMMDDLADMYLLSKLIRNEDDC
jgi:hypothetical protein